MILLERARRQMFIRYRTGRSLASYILKKRPLCGAGDAAVSGLNVNTRDLGLFVWRTVLPLATTFPYPPHELMLMASAVVALRPRLIVEWGTNVGVSSRVFLETVLRFGIEAEIHSIDLPGGAECFDHPGRLRGILCAGTAVKLHQGDGSTVACELLTAMGEDATSLVFIDGDHRYESVLKEGSAIWRTSPNAAILFHDTFPGTADNGPRKAVDQLIGKFTARPWIVEAQLGPPGMTLVIPRRTL